MKTFEDVSMEVEKVLNTTKYVATCKLCNNECFCYVGDPRGKSIMSCDIYVRTARGTTGLLSDSDKFQLLKRCPVCGKNFDPEVDTVITIENISVKAIYRLFSIVSGYYKAAAALVNAHNETLEYLSAFGLELDDWKRMHSYHERVAIQAERLITLLKDRCVKFTCGNVNETPKIEVPKIIVPKLLVGNGNQQGAA